MKKLLFVALGLCASVISTAQYSYPPTPVIPVVDTYFGTSVTDNYRWLENIKDSNVVKWFKDQADYTNSIISKIPGQQMLIDEMERLDSVQAILYGFPILANHTFFLQNGCQGSKSLKFTPMPNQAEAKMVWRNFIRRLNTKVNYN